MASPLSIQRTIQNAATKSGQPVTGDVQQLAQLISQLPTNEQAAYLQSIAQGIATGQVGQLSQGVIDQMVQQVQPQVQAALTSQSQVAGQPVTQQPAPQQATLTAATPTAPSLAQPTSAPAAAGTPNDPTATTGGAEGATTPGSATAVGGNTTSELQTYQQQFDAAGATVPTGAAQGVGGVMGTSQQLQYLAGYLGVAPEQVQSQYNAYVASTAATGSRAQGGAQGASSPGSTPLPIDQWVASQVTSIEGKYAPILNAYEQSWEQTNNSPMPPELRQQLRQQLQNLPPGQQQALDTTLYNYLLDYQAAAAPGLDPYQKAQALQTALSTVHGNLPILDQVFNNYQSTHISSTAEQNYEAQQQQSFIQTYVQATGKWPTDAEVKQYGTLPAVEQGQAIDNATMANLPMTYAQYQETLGLLNSGGGGSGATPWQEAFGTDPTPEQVYNMRGMNAQDIRGYIDNSSSKEIPGMTIGTYSNLQQVGEDVSTKLFGSSDSSQLIQMFHEANQKK